MSELTVLVPVLNRPHRVAPTLDSILGTAPGANVVFIVDPDDWAEHAAIKAAGAQAVVCSGNYASKINFGVGVTLGDHIFFGADDLVWSAGWYEAAVEWIASAGAQVVGVNDLCSRRSKAGEHATHFLVTRQYATARTIDGTQGPLFQGYDHSCVDDEFLEVAKHRGVAVVDPGIIVEHLHPDAGKAPMDSTYLKGRAQLRKDRRMLNARRQLWT